jgi:hypothetical protein
VTRPAFQVRVPTAMRPDTRRTIRGRLPSVTHSTGLCERLCLLATIIVQAVFTGSNRATPVDSQAASGMSH